MSHTTFDGAAVAVEALAVLSCQAPRSIHNHVATPTNCRLPDGGSISIEGDPQTELLHCLLGDHHRVHHAVAAPGWVSVTPHRRRRVHVPPEHSGNTHSPDWAPPTSMAAVAEGSAVQVQA
jgi:hypothetical protein